MTATSAPTAAVQEAPYPFLVLDSGLTSEQAARPERFETGHIVLSYGIRTDLGPNASLLAARLIMRHQTGDWGELDDEDKARNEWAIVHAARIISSYDLQVRGSDTLRTVMVLTEDDRSVTTVLYPEER